MFLTRLTIIDSSNEAFKYLQRPAHFADALAQRLASTSGPGNLGSDFSEGKLNDVGPSGISGYISSPG